MRKLIVWSLVSVCAMFCASSASAQMPRTISYQGILADASGNFVPDGNHSLVLTLYDAASAGAVVFAETQSVTVVRGVFNSILGSATVGGIPLSVTFDRAYFLGVKVDGGAELVPRTPLTASPYALHAAIADTVAVAPGAVAGQALTFNGSSLVYANPILQLPYSATVNSASTLLGLTNSGSGAGLSIQLTSAANGAIGLNLVHAGAGRGVFANTAGGTAVEGDTGSISAAGVIGRNLTGEAIVGFSSGGGGVGAVVGRSDGSGYGVRGFNTQNGIGVYGQAGISGGTGIAGQFQNSNAANTNTTLYVTTNSLGLPLLVEQTNASASGDLAVFRKSGNKARIDSTGKGFFDGGTQASGADVAEAFETEGDASTYEPGDVLVISRQHNRTVERSTTMSSTCVAGVYATKPGVVLTDRNIDANLADTVPMAVIGVVPTKVSGENGPIHRGDLLVTSSMPGRAMRAGDQPPAGSIIGKALEPFEASGTGVINVLVSIR
jgi:hypothetical protein